MTYSFSIVLRVFPSHGRIWPGYISNDRGIGAFLFQFLNKAFSIKQRSRECFRLREKASSTSASRFSVPSRFGPPFQQLDFFLKHLSSNPRMQQIDPFLRSLKIMNPALAVNRISSPTSILTMLVIVDPSSFCFKIPLWEIPQLQAFPHQPRCCPLTFGSVRHRQSLS